MTTDLVPVETAARALPNMAAGLLRAFQLLQQVKSFEDVERLFLLGAGLSPSTYKAYLASVKDFYQHTKGLHPLQAMPADIESWYDSMVARHQEPATINLRLAGLKKFFLGVGNVVPGFVSPFNVMGEKLTSKLGSQKPKGVTKRAMTKEELRKLLRWLRSEQDIRDYALIYFLATSGLRASEALSLRWRNLENDENLWTVQFVQKGGKQVVHEVFGPAVAVMREACHAVLGRDPLPDDWCFWVPASNGDISRGLTYHTAWHRVRAVGRAAVAAGIVRASLEFSPHLMRRTYCSQLYKAGMKLKALQQKSRHRSLEVLVSHYLDDSEPASPYLSSILEGVA